MKLKLLIRPDIFLEIAIKEIEQRKGIKHKTKILDDFLQKGIVREIHYKNHMQRIFMMKQNQYKYSKIVNDEKHKTLICYEGYSYK